MNAVNKLNRYTSLPVLLDLLHRKKLVLLDPRSWEDRNDSELVLEYARRRNVDKVFVVCFSYGNETIHHWRTYASGISGCCIQFDAEKLLGNLGRDKAFRHGKVVYRKLADVERGRIPLSQIPFTKRWPYRVEEEYRILWEGNTSETKIEIDIDLSSIRKVTISQHMPHQVYASIKRILNDDRGRIERVNRSTLYENFRWIRSFR